MNDKQIQRVACKLKRFEDDINALLYKNEAVILFKKFETKDKLTSPPADGFKDILPGDRWGGQKQYAWFAGMFTVPESLDGKRLFIMPGIGGYEGMLFVNGEPFGNFARKITFTAHGNHYCKMVADCARAGETYSLAIEAYAGHDYCGKMPEDKFDGGDFTYPVNDSHICTVNEDIYDFYYNLRTLNELWRSVEKDTFLFGRLSNLLLRIDQIIYYSLKDCDSDIFYGRVAEANAVLKSELFKHKSNPPVDGEARIIGHSHMDTAWLWEIDETIKKCARTYSNQVSMMLQYPEYLFIQSSAYHLELIRRNYPSLFDKIKDLIKAGRYEPNGGVWVECDCNITGGESMIRQFLWGQRYTREHFGYTSNTFWLPDTFGYSASIPQIMKGCGIDYFCTTKLEWNDTTDFPYDTFYWQGIDGTKVLAHFNKTNLWPAPEDIITYTSKRNMRNIVQKQVSNKRLISFGYGDGGGGPEPDMAEMARRCADLEGCPKATYQTVGDFMSELEKTIVNPATYVGELYLELHRGTLTSQHCIKRNNRRAETALRNAELVCVAEAVKNNKPATGSELNPYTETLLVNQFHDILPGTSIPEVHDRTCREMENLIESVSGITKNKLCIKPDDTKLALVNTLSFERRDVYSVVASEDCSVDAPCNQQLTTDIDGTKILKLSGLPLNAFECKTLNVRKSKPVSKSAFTYNNDTLTTPFAKVTFAKNGTISSFIDLRVNREIKGGGYNFNTFIMCEDYPLTWDNWDLDADTEHKYEDVSKLASRSMVADGAVEFRIRSKYNVSKKSFIEQDMVFYADNPRVDFETKIHWDDVHRFLKTAFDTNIHTDYVRQDIQFGHVIRPATRNTKSEQAKFETLNHKFSDVSESRYGVAVLNDGKYGISVLGGSMRLSLIKSGTHPDFRADKGIHKCTYSLLPHDSGFNAQSVIGPAYEVNTPPVIVEGESALPGLGLVSVDAPNVIIEIVKPCEDVQKAYIVRMFEAENNYTRTKFRISHAAKGAEITNMLEETLEVLPAGNEIELVFKPFEIKSVKIKY